MVVLLLASIKHDASAQYHGKRGLQFGAKVGASSYNGDVNAVRPGENQYDLTFEGEMFYRFGRWFGLGVKHSVGRYPELSTTEPSRSSTALAIRSYLLNKRMSPYIQLGASRSTGGDDVGYGLAVATGFELEMSRYVSLFQDISFDQVIPDAALDGTEGGRNFDLFGRIGVGLRVNLSKKQSYFRLARVEQADSIMIGEEGEFRAIVRGVDESDVSFEWDLPGGVVYRENPIRHSFASPGTYQMNLSMMANGEERTEVVYVNVFKPFVPDTAAAAEKDRLSVKIASLTGDKSLEAGSEGTYQIRTVSGAAQPIQFEWDMGDGSTRVGNYVVHRFDEPGVYRVFGRVVNEFGDDSRILVVEVLPRTTPVVEDVIADVKIDSTVTPVVGNEDEDIAAPEAIVPATDSAAVPVQDDAPINETPAPNAPVERNVSHIDFDAGGYSWVVELHDTASAAAAKAEEYKYIGFPYGTRRDPESGKFAVLVGQFETEAVALKISWRIQQHASRRIWLTKIK